ncbi:hypothetical protein S83_023827, partial [Arachis hypogaea]
SLLTQRPSCRLPHSPAEWREKSLSIESWSAPFSSEPFSLVPSLLLESLSPSILHRVLHLLVPPLS